jgi:hypothetical protein
MGQKCVPGVALLLARFPGKSHAFQLANNGELGPLVGEPEEPHYLQRQLSHSWPARPGSVRLPHRPIHPELSDHLKASDANH